MPKPGDKIYLPSRVHLSHGTGDLQGGVCTIAAIHAGVQSGQDVLYVEIEEDPGKLTLWDTYLEPMQDSLRAKFGDQKGGPDPDLRPEFNEGNWPSKK